MLPEKESEFLRTDIVLNCCLAANDVNRAKEVAEKLNAMDLDSAQQGTVNDAIRGAVTDPREYGPDAARYLVQNLNCVSWKEEQLKILAVNEAIIKRDRVAGNRLLDEYIHEGMFDGDFNWTGFTQLLITLCRILGRYDKMGKIYSILEQAQS